MVAPDHGAWLEKPRKILLIESLAQELHNQNRGASPTMGSSSLSGWVLSRPMLAAVDNGVRSWVSREYGIPCSARRLFFALMVSRRDRRLCR